MFRNLSDDVHDQIMKLVDKKSFPPGSNVTKQGSGEELWELWGLREMRELRQGAISQRNVTKPGFP